MAKPLVVEFQGTAIELTLEKIERSRLYGYVDVEVVDDSGKRCELATLIGDGHSVVGKGGTAIAYLSQGGLWLRKTELKAVDVHGSPIIPVKSSFDAPIPLVEKATIDDYLTHNVHLVYRLIANQEHSGLMTELRNGTIFKFPFSYRGGAMEASAGFVLLGGDGNMFLCVGVPTALEFAGLKATAAVVPDEETAAADDDDALDFSLV